MNNNNILSKDITVVVQGNVIRKGDIVQARNGVSKETNNWNEGLDITKECLDSIRKHLPESKIVLSTYTNSNLEGLDYDELVLSEDPGAEGFIFPKQPNNINRIIKTSIEGIKKVDTEYCLKVRSDSLIDNLDFLYIYNKWKDIKPDSKNSLFKNRVLANGLLTLDIKTSKIPYTLNDWFFLGHTEDLHYLFDIPLFDINSTQFIQKKDNVIKKAGKATLDGLITPEQYVFINAIQKKFKDASLDFYEDTGKSNTNLKRTEDFLLGNFVFVEGLEFGIKHKKNDKTFKEQLKDSYSYNNFCESFSKKYNTQAPTIDNKDITVVVQGLVDKTNTLKCLNSIKTYLPNSYVIVSTWEGSDVKHIKDLCDKIIFNKDPGGTPHYDQEDSILNNTNRQIVSTFEGIKEVKTRYTLKIRTDFYLTGNKFLDFFYKYNEFCDHLRVARRKILSCNLYARNPNYKKLPFPFHPSDFALFGLTEDVYKVFNVPLVSNEDALYFKTRPYPKANGLEFRSLPRYFPEQHIWTNFLNYKDLKFTVDITRKNIINSEISFANNLVILSLKDLCIYSDKPGLFEQAPHSCYNDKDWILLYSKYCQNIFNQTILDEISYRISKITFYGVKRFIFYKKIKNGKKIVKIFKIPVYHSKIKK